MKAAFRLGLLSLALALQANAKPASPSLEVSVQSRGLRIPGIPGSVTEARSGYAQAQQEILATMAEMERDLTQLCTEAANDEPRFLAGLRIPKASCSEAHRLIDMLSRADFEKDAEAVNQCWSDWQTDLLRVALADPDGGPIIHNLSGAPYVPRFVCTILFDRRDGAYCQVLFEDTGELQLLRLDGFSCMAISRVPYHKRSELAKNLVQISEAYVPSLKCHWDLLTGHMNAAAVRWLDIERNLPPTRDLDLMALRRVTRFQFLERYRSALWFCYNIWAHMASETVPPPIPGQK